MIRATQASRLSDADSPKPKIPRMTVPTAPIPVHTAWAVPTGRVRIAVASKKKLRAMVIREKTEGQRRVKPSEYLRPMAHPTSSRSAMMSRIQFMVRLQGWGVGYRAA
jgi:hypothetical protein